MVEIQETGEKSPKSRVARGKGKRGEEGGLSCQARMFKPGWSEEYSGEGGGRGVGSSWSILVHTTEIMLRGERGVAGGVVGLVGWYLLRNSFTPG